MCLYAVLPSEQEKQARTGAGLSYKKMSREARLRTANLATQLSISPNDVSDAVFLVEEDTASPGGKTVRFTLRFPTHAQSAEISLPQGPTPEAK